MVDGKLTRDSVDALCPDRQWQLVVDDESPRDGRKGPPIALLLLLSDVWLLGRTASPSLLLLAQTRAHRPYSSMAPASDTHELTSKGKNFCLIISSPPIDPRPGSSELRGAALEHLFEDHGRDRRVRTEVRGWTGRIRDLLGEFRAPSCKKSDRLSLALFSHRHLPPFVICTTAATKTMMPTEFRK
jgi:hypothetical protein